MSKKSNKRKNKKVTMASWVILSILLLLSIVFFGIVLLLGVILNKHLSPVIVVYCIYVPIYMYLLVLYLSVVVA